LRTPTILLETEEKLSRVLFKCNDYILLIFNMHTSEKLSHKMSGKGKGKGLPQEAEVAQGVPGTLRPRIFLTFGTTRVAGRQPYAPAAITPGEIPGTHF
jgi:hypothetical protein